MAQRHDIIRAVSSPTMRLKLAKGPPPRDRELMRQRDVMRHARRLLRPLSDRPVIFARIGDWDHPIFGGDRHGPREPDILPSRAKMIVGTTLIDGQWVHFVLATDLTSLRWALRTAFWVLSLGGVIVLFSVWAAYRATRPLRKLGGRRSVGIECRCPAARRNRIARVAQDRTRLQYYAAADQTSG